MVTKTFDSAAALHTRRVPLYPMMISLVSLREIFSACADFQTRSLYLGLDSGRRVTLCWIDGLVSAQMLTEDVIRPLTSLARLPDAESSRQSVLRILAGAVYNCSARSRETMDQVVEDLTHGCCVLLFERAGQAVSFEARSETQRSVSEPTLEKSIKGAKDAFVETLRVNTALVRRRLCTPRLKLVEAQIGRASNTRVALFYLEGAADPAAAAILAQRLDALDVEGLLSAGILEERLTDAPGSPFPQLLHTERPDRFSQYIMEGRIGLLIDGLPIGLCVPVTLADFLRGTGDGASNWLVSSALTLLRWMALVLSMLLPALYVAIALYHQEMIPTRLLLSVIEAKQKVPFSTALEVIGMLLSFELLQEAGLHLPNPIGDTVSIIGALIVGQSAVEARVVSPIAIIVVAFAGIAGYTLPSQDLGAAVRLIRMGLVFAAVAGGLFGVGAGLCLLLLHLAELDSLGLNYTAPLSDGRPLPLLRLILRGPGQEAEPERSRTP